MKLKHKLLTDFQYLSDDKKIITLKSGSIIEEYNFNLKGESIKIDKEIIDANPEIFSIVDWKSELLTFIKSNKLPQPAILTKKITPFIEDMILSSMSKSDGKIDDSKLRELESRETDLFSKEQILNRQESSIESSK